MASSCARSPRYKAYGPDTPDEHGYNEQLNEKLAVIAAQDDDDTEYRIGSEDLLEITLFDIEDRDGEPRVVTTRVSNTGFVTLPLVGKVTAEGFTPLQFEEHIRAKYTRFIREPQLSVFVQEYRSYEISVIGYVENPGVLHLQGRRTLLEALALAGGLNNEAGRTVRFRREVGDTVITDFIDLTKLAQEGDVRLNPVLLPNDVVHVPRAGVFYVEGLVNNAGAFPLLQDTTVTQAIATAGGPDVELARMGGTTLFRKRKDGEREAIPVDIAAIRKGTSDDFLVLEDDVIVVPLSHPKYWFDRALGLVRLGIGLRP